MTTFRLLPIVSTLFFAASAYAAPLEIPEDLARGINVQAVRAAADAKLQEPLSVEIRPIKDTAPLSDFIGQGVTVHLKNGGQIMGILLDDSDKIWIEIEGGKIGLEFASVSHVDVLPNKYSEFREREAAVADTDVPALWTLAQWAQSKGMSSYARMTALRVITLEPDHAAARALLGYEKIGGRWLTYDEAMTAKGFIRFEGRWMPKAEYDSIIREREARRQARVEEERQRRLEEEARRQAEHERELERLRELQRLQQWHRHHHHHYRGAPRGPIIIVIPPHHGPIIVPGRPFPSHRR